MYLTRGELNFFYFIKISRKSLLFVKYKSTYCIVEPFPHGHLCSTDSWIIGTADSVLFIIRNLLDTDPL